MSQARLAFATGHCGKVASFLLILAFAAIWHSGAGARSQPPRDKGGMLSVTIHPDEGLRQLVHYIQKRGEDRSSGALPDSLGLPPDGARLALALAGQPQEMRPAHWAAPCDLPAAMARAPPRLA